MDWLQRLFSGWEIAAVGYTYQGRFLSAGTAYRASLSTWRPRGVRCAIYHECKTRPRRSRSSVRAHRRAGPKRLAACHLCLPLPVLAHLSAPSVRPHEPELESTPSRARAPSTRLHEPPTDELLRHRRRPRHPERATPSHWSLSSNTAPPSPIQAASMPVRARCAAASASASGAAHSLLSCLCFMLHLGAELSPPHASLSIVQDCAATLRRAPVPSVRLAPAPRCPPRAAGFTVTMPPCH
jgi:hypothetical protein